ncbi:helix-turn-helix domain-containing protein [Streptomyces sp. NPDC058611]
MTLAELSEQSGVSLQSLSNYENGPHRASPHHHGPYREGAGLPGVLLRRA